MVVARCSSSLRTVTTRRDKSRRISGARGNCFARCWTARLWRLSRRDAEGHYLSVNVELQEDFSLDQALSLYLFDTIPLVDPQQPD